MLLESFVQQLETTRDFAKFRFGVIDPIRLGSDLKASFIVEIRVALGNQNPVELMHVGKLTPRGIEIIFEPANSLKEDVQDKILRLGDFLKSTFGTLQSRFLGKFDWRTIFTHWSVPKEISSGSEYEIMVKEFDAETLAAMLVIESQETMEKLAIDMLMAQQRRDKNLKRLDFALLEEACCLLIHDAIVCGAGIELETIGLFRKDLLFCADEEHLLKVIKIKHAKEVDQDHPEDFEAY